MKNYPVFIGIFLFLLVSVGVQAQKFGFRAGLNLATMSNRDDFTLVGHDYSVSPGLVMGSLIEFPLSKFFSIESGLILSTKGYNYVYTDSYINLKNSIYHVDENATLYYLDIPITIKLQDFVPPSGKIRIYVDAGLYGGVGISGRFRQYELTYYSEEEVNEEVSWGSRGKDRYRRFDYGLVWGAGIGFRNYEIGFQHHYGLANIASDRSLGQTYNNQVFSFTLGFRM